MTDIDSLSGRELDEAVCVAMGWTTEVRDGKTLWHQPYMPVLFSRPPSTDIGAAFGLLLPFFGVSVHIDDDDVSVVHRMVDDSGRVTVRKLATGPKSEAAAVMCRAFLKLKQEM